MSFLDSLGADMFSIFETINSKANEMTESVKSSLNGLDSDSVLDLFTETNEKVSRIFSHDEDAQSGSQSHAASSNGNHVQLERDKHRNKTCAAPARPADTVKKQATLIQQDSFEEDLPSYDENLPGYAKSTAYLAEREVCRRVTVTSRKLTEADLDEEDPLYCDRETRQKQGSPSYQEENEEEGVGLEIVRCFREHFERLRILILESFLDLDLT
jgi:hypothetical protein